MSGGQSEGRHTDRRERISAREMESMREDELLDFISETVEQLNRLGDRLEAYAKERIPQKGDQ